MLGCDKPERFFPVSEKPIGNRPPGDNSLVLLPDAPETHCLIPAARKSTAAVRRNDHTRDCGRILVAPMVDRFPILSRLAIDRAALGRGSLASRRCASAQHRIVATVSRGRPWTFRTPRRSARSWERDEPPDSRKKPSLSTSSSRRHSREWFFCGQWPCRAWKASASLRMPATVSVGLRFLGGGLRGMAYADWSGTAQFSPIRPAASARKAG